MNCSVPKQRDLIEKIVRLCKIDKVLNTNSNKTKIIYTVHEKDQPVTNYVVIVEVARID